MKRLGVYFFVLFLTTVVLNLSGQENKNFPHNNKTPAQAEKLINQGEVFFEAGEFDKAIKAYTEASEYYKNANLTSDYISALIEIGHCYRRKGDFKKALEYVDISEKKAAILNNPKDNIYSKIYHLKGTLVANSGDHRASIPYYVKTIEIKIFNNGNKDTSLSSSYNNLGNTYFYLGDYDEAAALYKKALEIAKYRIVYESADVALFNLSTAIVYSIKGDFDKAKLHYSESLRIGRKVFAKDDDELARILMNTGAFLNQLGKYETAIAALNSAKDVFINKFSDNYYELGHIYTNIGRIHINKGDNGKASENYHKALSVFRTNYDRDHPEIASALMNLGYSYFLNKEYDKSLIYYFQSIAIKNAEKTLIRTRTYRNIARSYEQKGDTAQARKYYEIAINHSIDLLGDKHYETGNSYLAMGEFLSKNGQSEDGLLYFNKALNIFITTYGAKHQDVAYCYTNIGDYYFNSGKFYKSLEFYQKALIALNVKFDKTDIYTNPDIRNHIPDQNLIRPLSKKASAFVKLFNGSNKIKDLETGFSTYLLALDLLDKLRAGYSQSSQLDLSERTGKIYPEAIRTALKLGEVTGNSKFNEQAFELSEKSKAAILLSAIRNIEAKSFGKVPKALTITESEIKKEIALYNKLVYQEELKQEPSTEKISLWKSKLLALGQQQEALEKFLTNNYPGYFALKYDSKVLGLKDIQNKLQKNQNLIEYSYSDTSITIFLITPKDYSIVNVSIDSSFIKTLTSFISAISDNRFAEITKFDFQKYIYSANTLYHKLILPIEKNIIGDRLIIVTDGILGYIPFEALITSLPDDERLEYRKKAYLIYKYSVSYSYSATLLYSNQYGKRATEEVIAFAPKYPEFSPENTAYNRGNDSLEAINAFLSPLPGALEEVNSLNKFIKTQIWADTSATESRFKASAGEYDIIHLAMHTVIDDKNPMYSKLAFYRPDKGKDDGFLNTYEIYNLDLKARLAVLSACNTGYGKLQGGEGIMSLARGFMYAGCPSILMTLWPVEDKSGADLMTSFYKHLSTGLSKDQALRQAKLEHLENADQIRAHPFFWSGYVNIGDPEPLIKSNSFQSIILILVVILLLLAVISIYIIRKKGNNRKFIFRSL